LKRYFRLILLGICGLLLFTIPTAAHANLIDSIPSQGVTLQTSPETLLLTFTEPLELTFVRLKLFDATGSLLALGAPMLMPNAPQTVIATFPPNLPHGLYTLSWRVVSAADGHATEGAYTFAIGVRFQENNLVNSPTAIVAPSTVIIRWVNLSSFALFIGGLGFALFVSPDVPRRWLWIGWWSVGFSGILMLLNQAAISADVPLLSPDNWAATGRLLDGTAFSESWLIRMLIWCGIGIVLIRITSLTGLRITFFLGLGMLYAHALTSHAAAQTTHPEAVFMDALHLLGASLWMGGLVAFCVMLWRTRHDSDRTTIAARLTDNFSILARLCVLILALTGFYSAWLHVGGLEPLPVTTYGRALIIKNILFGVMLMLAVVNLLLTSRRLREGDFAWVRVLRGLVLMEIILAGGVIVASAWMTSDMPASEAYRLAQAAESLDISLTNFFEMQVIEGKMLHLDIVPGTVGENTFSLTLFNPDGSPMIDASRVGLRFTHLDNLVGESTLRAEHIGYGIYRVMGTNLSVPGTWRIRLSIRQPDQFDVITDFEVVLP
jgi:copper transport protein